MSRVSGRSTWLAFACLAMFVGFVAIANPSAAKAEDTVWICKPGQSDDLCAGTIAGSTLPPPNTQAVPLEYTRPENAPIDCFYLYPTQSEQETPNSNLDKDPPIRRVVVQQARMFSTVCNVYAPMYRQVTYSGNQLANNPDVEVAYSSAKDAFEDYLENYNNGRGFIMLGHSQGSAHTARLIDEMVDTDSELRKRFVGAIAPGANIHVPINETVGGRYENVPACSAGFTYGCIVAYSMFTENPGANAPFSRLDFGYWIYPDARPDDSQFEAMCVNPAQLDGSDGVLLPLVNMDYISGVPSNESASPWLSAPEYYSAACQRDAGSHWLNVSKLDLPGETRPNLGALVASGINWHVPEVNLAEGNLLSIAGTWSGNYATEQTRIARLKAKIKELGAKVKQAKKSVAAAGKKATKFSKQARKAKGKRKQALQRKAKAARKTAASGRKRIKSLNKQIAGLKKQLPA